MIYELMCGWAVVNASLTAPEPQNLKDKASVKISKEEPLKIKGDVAQFMTSQKVTVFMGNVQMTHAGNFLVCETLKAYGETADRAERTECFGKVLWRDDARGAVLTCDMAIYEKSVSHLIARGNPILVVDRAGIKTVVKGEELEIFQRDQRALAHRKVHVTRLTTTATGEEAEYNYRIEEVKMTGQPVVTQKKSVFKGKEIWLFLKEDRVEIRNEVDAEVYPEDVEEEKPKENK